MKILSRSAFCLPVVLAGLMVTHGAYGEPAQAFNDNVAPILVGRCLECHSDGMKGGLDLRSADALLKGGDSGAAIVPGKPKESLLFQRVADHEMPPKKPLSDPEIDALRQWITDGAWFPEKPLNLFAVTTDKRAGYDWWSFQPVRDVSPPAIAEPENPLAALWAKAWDDHPIDRFVFARMRDQGLTPSVPALPNDLIRRATYDLTGLPPTPAEVTAFEEACRAETGSAHRVGDQAYAALIDRLLESPHYGERWGRHWMDVVRYGESTGYEVNHLIDNIWPYRDYIINSLNADKPFDRMTREQIAGDTVDPGNPDVEVGMTFLVAGPHDIVGNQDPVAAAQIRANAVDEIIRTTSEAFLGLTVGCARCHDHKFDAISQRDYYRFYATFAGVHHGDREVATAEQRAAREEKAGPLKKERNKLSIDRSGIERDALRRGEKKLAEYEAQWTRDPVNRRGTEETFEPVEAKFLRLVAEGTDGDPNARTGFRIDEFEVWSAEDAARNVALKSNGATATGASSSPGDFADAYTPDLAIDGNYRARWIAASPTLTIEFAKPERINRVLFSSDRPAAVSADSGEARFVCEYRIEVSSDGETWTEVANSHDRKPATKSHRDKRILDAELTDDDRARMRELDKESAEFDKQLAAIPGFPVLRVGRLLQPDPEQHIFLGGDPQRKGDTVVPAAMTGLDDATGGYALAAEASEQDRRKALADWITAEDNPLTPRVLANRLWHYHFGTGLVSTPSDFGFMGMAPTHPDLLDWLARELVQPSYGPDASPDQAWRLKRMHRIIMTSRTYRQATHYRAEMANTDGDSRLLWRYPPRRLSGEELRDTMLAMAGELDTKMGGPGFRLYSYLRDNVSTYVPLEAFGPETYRRSVYHQTPRAARIDLLTEFDAPDCAFTTPRRAETTSPMQALTMLNHSFTLDMAEALASRLEEEAPEDPAGRAFELAFARAPEADERARARELIDAHGLRAFCRALFNVNELIYLN
jgi:hypothetical protein